MICKLFCNIGFVNGLEAAAAPHGASAHPNRAYVCLHIVTRSPFAKGYHCRPVEDFRLKRNSQWVQNLTTFLPFFDLNSQGVDFRSLCTIDEDER